MSAPKCLILVAAEVLLGAAILAACVMPPGALINADATPSANLTPTDEPTPALPDPQVDPLVALLYSRQPGVLRSATISVTDALTASQTVGGGYLPGLWPGDPPPAETEDQKSARVAAEATVMAAPPAEQPVMMSKQRGSGALQVVTAAITGINYRLDYAQSFAMFVGEMRLPDSESRGECIKVGPAQWTRPAAGQWTTGTNASLPAPDTALQAAWRATAAQWVGQEQLGGESVEHLTFTSPYLQELRFLAGNDRLLVDWSDMIASDPAARPITSTIRADAWLGTGDLLPRQLTFALETSSVVPTLRLRLVLIRRHTLALSDLNRPVTIEPPPAATPAGD